MRSEPGLSLEHPYEEGAGHGHGCLPGSANDKCTVPLICCAWNLLITAVEDVPKVLAISERKDTAVNTHVLRVPAARGGQEFNLGGSRALILSRASQFEMQAACLGNKAARYALLLTQ
jgi:hypothetical protein